VTPAPASRRGLLSGISWRALMAGVRERLRGRDLALIAAGLTFYAGIAIVPLLLLALSLTAALTSPEAVQALGERLEVLLPGEIGAPAAVRRGRCCASAPGRRRGRPGAAGWRRCRCCSSHR
jgi:hypothetical protein